MFIVDGIVIAHVIGNDVRIHYSMLESSIQVVFVIIYNLPRMDLASFAKILLTLRLDFATMSM
jgi:hypothetical protein